jgi:dihydrofolate synthase/folylpolyglutamate synthase
VSEADRFHRAITDLEALARQPVLPARQVGLSRARRLLSELGDPHRSFRAVHVTGSSGKGSTTTMIGSILEASGFRTGYLRSPHLSSYTERITVADVRISETAWAESWERLQPLVEAMAANELPGYELGRPTFSEVIFAMATLYFGEQNVEWAALEAGLGGRYDATNVVESDVAVVTTVSLEHTHLLGDTLPAIAGEKAAIIKPGTSAVTGATEPDALRVIEERASTVHAPLLRVPTDVGYSIRTLGLDGTRMRLGWDDSSLEIELALIGEFQAMNAAVAAAAALALRCRAVPVELKAVARGLRSARIPGRLEIAGHSPLVILDGAHHPAAVAALRDALDPLLAGMHIVLLFTALADKDVAGMAGRLRGLAHSIVLTTAPGTPRALSPEALAPQFQGEARLLLEDEPSAALKLAMQAAGPNGVLVVCGSLYLVGRIREILLRAGVTP